jgi:hypothetical protein
VATFEALPPPDRHALHQPPPSVGLSPVPPPPRLLSRTSSAGSTGAGGGVAGVEGVDEQGPVSSFRQVSTLVSSFLQVTPLATGDEYGSHM